MKNKFWYMAIAVAALLPFAVLHLRTKEPEPENIPLIITFSSEPGEGIPLLVLSKDNRYVGATEVIAGNDFNVMFYDRENREAWTYNNQRPQDQPQPNFMFFTADNKKLIAGGSDVGGFGGSIQIWSVPERKLIRKLAPNKVYGPAVIFPDGSTMAYGNERGELVRININTGKIIDSTPTFKKRQMVSLAVSSDGKLICATYSYSDQNLEYSEVCGGITLYDVATRKQIWNRDFKVEAKSELFYIGNIAFSPDGKTIAQVGLNGVTDNYSEAYVALLDARSGNEIRRIANTGVDIDFSSDGKLLISGTSTWNVNDGSIDSRLKGKLSKDGKYVVAYSENLVEPEEFVFDVVPNDGPNIEKRSISMWKRF